MPEEKSGYGFTVVFEDADVPDTVVLGIIPKGMESQGVMVHLGYDEAKAMIEDMLANLKNWQTETRRKSLN